MESDDLDPETGEDRAALGRLLADLLLGAPDDGDVWPHAFWAAWPPD
ncbi:hypothetical protein [Actinomadura atramentaria]|nr:hypothetical protein [Actinomadura atramentaria]